jgi:manganese/zinc/iron transport system permease protein
MLRWLLRQGEHRGLLEVGGSSVQLTPLGWRRAAETTKTHRMWEIYMMEFAGSAPDHVDRSADEVEHLLPESLLVELEDRLAREGRLPITSIEMPKSPHEIIAEGTG